MVGTIFLVTWQLVVPTAVQQRVNMTENSSGQLDTSAEARVKLWEEAKTSMLSSPMLGTGFATYQYAEHVYNLRDTHNWYIKVMVETGLLGI